MTLVRVIGIGNDMRGDDAAGLLVARFVAGAAPAGVSVLESDGEPATLMESWRGADAVYLIDCCVGGGQAGATHRFDLRDGPLATRFGAVSSHGVDLAATLELTRALDGLPPRMIVFAIEGRDFEVGAQPSAAIRAMAEDVASRILLELSGQSVALGDVAGNG